MARRRFIVDTDDFAVHMPAGKVHYPKGTPVELDDAGTMFPFVAGKLRAEDPQRDRPGQAAVLLDRQAYMPSGHARGVQQ